MYCEKCGAKIRDMSEFCEKCGAPVQKQVQLNQEQMQPVQYQNPASAAASALPMKKYNKAAIIGGIATAIICLAVTIFIVVFTGNGGYKNVVDEYMTASFNLDGYAFMDLFPGQVVKEFMNEAGYEYGINERDSFIFNEQSDLLDAVEQILGDDWRYKVNQINDDLKYDIEHTWNFSKDDLERRKQEYEMLGVDISAGKGVEIKVTVEDTDFEYTDYIYLVKVGDSWCLDDNMHMNTGWLDYLKQYPTN